MIEETLTEDDIAHFLSQGYISCKKGWFGKKKYEITPSGMEYLQCKMFEKLRYIQ